VAEERLAMFRQAIVATVEGVDGGEPEVVVEQVGHGTAVEPRGVEFPLAAGTKQAINDKGFEHFEPGRAFLGGGQKGLPEGIQIQTVPEFQRKPATSPLSWTGQFDAIEAELERRMFESGIGCTILREETNLLGVIAFIDGLDGAGPGGAVSIVDLAKIKQGLLDGSAACHPAVLDDAPVTVLLAVLESFVRTQEHDLAWSIPPGGRACRQAGSPPQAFSEGDPWKIKGCSASESPNSSYFRSNSGSRANIYIPGRG
jgi:hypothetical protein